MSLNSDLNIILQIKKDIYNSINEKTPVSSSVSFDEYPSILDSFAEKRCKILKIVPTPVDSTVTFDKTSFQNQAATALNGTISYTVSKEGYGTVSGTVVMNESKVLDVVLKKYYTFSKSYSTSDSITFPEDAFDIIVKVVGRGGDCGTRYTSGSRTYYGGKGAGVPNYKAKAGAIIITYKYYNTVA